MKLLKIDKKKNEIKRILRIKKKRKFYERTQAL